MTIEIGIVYSLMDREGRSLGTVEINAESGQFLCGTLDKSADFSRYEKLFKDHQDYANHQQFLLVDEIESKISDIGAYLYRSGDKTVIQIKDLQIMNENDVCFRLL
jgi:hypothetical protein